MRHPFGHRRSTPSAMHSVENSRRASSAEGSCAHNALAWEMRWLAQVQRIGKFGTCRRRGNTHVKQLGMVGLQANLDVAQRLAPSELRKGHDAKQIGAAERTHTRIAL